jgi:hypothetical protein
MTPGGFFLSAFPFGVPDSGSLSLLPGIHEADRPVLPPCQPLQARNMPAQMLDLGVVVIVQFKKARQLGAKLFDLIQHDGLLNRQFVLSQ